MTREIPLTMNAFAIVDDDDYEKVAAFKWRCHVNRVGRVHRRYAVRTVYLGGRNSTLLLHRVLLSPSPEMHVDHINGDGLDNRRANLRICTCSENLRNQRPRGRSGFKGVTWRGPNWAASLVIAGKHTHLGMFATAEEAARAFDRAAVANLGPFARLNFPDESAAQKAVSKQ